MPTDKIYKMTIDPSILELLGPSLYTNIYYVLAELIANAYDAGAKNVYVIAGKDEITVEDDGTGMTYKDVTDHYLAVARESRATEEESWTQDGTRHRMGRKGIGKLAALSVSSQVLVQTRSGNDVSGFVLVRRVKNNLLEPIPEDRILFKRITGNGTTVVMLNPEYRLHKTLSVVKKNIAKIFPAVGNDFKIHIIRDDEEEVLDGFDSQILDELCAITTFGDRFAPYANSVLPQDVNHSTLAKQYPSYKEPIVLEDQKGVSHEYVLEVYGWLGAYKTTRDRKISVTDFPDNHIALYANEKLGEFNILPTVGQNRLIEVFIVGQLHVDLFEATELPDMALSNRQGYKSDDKRYQAVIELVKRDLLPRIVELRKTWADIQKSEAKQRKLDEQAQQEAVLREKMREYRQAVGKSAADAAASKIKSGQQISADDIRKIVEAALNRHQPDIGLKKTVDGLKKKLLISHTGADKDFADIAYKMLQYNGMAKENIIYTASDDEECRIPRGTDIFDYLRRFFVESASTEMIYVLFITSKKMAAKWPVLSEVGAAWVTRSKHQVFNIAPFKPEKPLNVNVEWQVTHRDRDGSLYVTKRDADVYCCCIEGIVKDLGVEPQSRDANMRYLATLLEIRT